MAIWKTYGFDNDTKKYLDAVAVTGGSISYGTAQYVNQFVETCKASGVWDSISECGAFVGDDLNTALVKLKWSAQTSPYLVNNGFVAADYSATGVAGGLSGDGTSKYLDTTTILPGVDSAHLSVYCRNNVASATAKSFIGTNVTNAQLAIMRKDTANALSIAIGTGLAIPVFTSVPVQGYFLGTRYAPDSTTLFTSGVSQSTSSTSLPVFQGPTLRIPVFARYTAVATPSEYTNGLFSFYSIGAGLTTGQALALSQAVLRLQSNLNRGVI